MTIEQIIERVRTEIAKSIERGVSDLSTHSNDHDALYRQIAEAVGIDMGP